MCRDWAVYVEGEPITHILLSIHHIRPIMLMICLRMMSETVVKRTLVLEELAEQL